MARAFNEINDNTLSVDERTLGRGSPGLNYCQIQISSDKFIYKVNDPFPLETGKHQHKR